MFPEVGGGGGHPCKRTGSARHPDSGTAHQQSRVTSWRAPSHSTPPAHIGNHQSLFRFRETTTRQYAQDENQAVDRRQKEKREGGRHALRYRCISLHLKFRGGKVHGAGVLPTLRLHLHLEVGERGREGDPSRGLRLHLGEVSRCQVQKTDQGVCSSKHRRGVHFGH